MKLTLEDVLPLIEEINGVAQMQNMDIKASALYVIQELKLNRQLGGIQRQIERANQELALINMTTIQKEEALTVLMDLVNRGVTESQIVQLINFATEWNKHWQSSTTQQPDGSSNPGSNNGNNGNFSMNDLIRLNLLKSTLNRMGSTPNG